jgi:hypothetical protein
MANAVVNPWDKQFHEPARMFAMFTAFRDMGYERTLVAVSAKFDLHGNTVRKYSVKWRWPERADSWDRHLDKEKQGETVAAVRLMAAKQAETAQRMYERIVKACDVMPDDRIEAFTPTEKRQWIVDMAKLWRDALGVPERVVETIQTQETRIVEKSPEERQARIKQLLRVVNGGK